MQAPLMEAQEHRLVETPTSSRFARFLKSTVAACAVGLCVYLVYQTLTREDDYVVEGVVRKNVWCEAVNDSPLWQVYFDVRAASSNARRPFVRFKANVRTRRSYWGVVVNLTVYDAATNRELFSGNESWPQATEAVRRKKLLRKAAGVVILAHTGDDDRLIRALAAEIRKDTPGRSDCIWILGAIGPEARAAVPALQEVAQRGAYAGIRTAALQALARIAPGEHHD